MFWKRLKQYLPRSLYGRAVLILLLPVVTVQLLVSVVFIQRHYEGVTQSMTRSLLLELEFVLPQIAAAPDLASAEQVIVDVAAPLGLTIAFVGPEVVVPETDNRRILDLSGRVMIAELRADMPEIRAIDLQDLRTVRFWIDQPLGRIMVSLPRDRVSASNPHQLLVIMVVMGGLMTVVSYLFLRNQLRPIRRMAHAASEYGKGRIVPFNPTGATEVRIAGAAFLDMRNRIERQTQSRTMMLSGISHDLRTPLTRLRLGLSLLDDAEAAPMVRDVEDMQGLIDGFLDFARIEAGGEVVLTDPKDILDGIAADARRISQSLTVVCPQEGAGEQIKLRPMAIRRALDNLVGNALRYGSSARLSMVWGEKSLRFVVEDDGPGIPTDQRDEATKPFTRLDPARNQDRGTGVGLGLAIVSEIARLHGGSLRLGESPDMGGLMAELVLPR